MADVKPPELETFEKQKIAADKERELKQAIEREVIEALNDGLGINAAVRTFKVAKNTIYNWLERVADLKEPLLLYALCHQFLSQIVEGDELYTKVKENKAPDQSEGWTIVLMDRASRFLWELKCGQRDRL